MSNQRTTEDLRRMLFGTIEKINSGQIDQADGKTIALLAERIISTAELELKYATVVSRLDRDGSEVTPGPLMLTNRTDD